VDGWCCEGVGGMVLRVREWMGGSMRAWVVWCESEGVDGVVL